MIIGNASKYISTPVAKIKLSDLRSENINLYQIKCTRLILDFSGFNGIGYKKINIVECTIKYIVIINTHQSVITRYTKSLEIIRSNIERIYSQHKIPFCKGEEYVKLINMACGKDFNHNNADIVNIYIQSISL